MYHYTTGRDAGIGAGFPYSKLITRTLYLQVFDYDRFSRDDPIGEVCLPLADVDLSTTQTMWKTLQPCKGHVVSTLSVRRLKAKFHYTGPTGHDRTRADPHRPARTLSETRTNPTEFLGDPGRKKVRAGPVGPV